MANVRSVTRVGNFMVVAMDDNTEIQCVPTGYGTWLATAGAAVPTPPGAVFKWPFARSLTSTYPGHSGVDWAGSRVGNTADVKAIGPGTVSSVTSNPANTYNDPGGSYEPIWRGISVTVDHGFIDGVQTYSLYAHLSSRVVNEGDTITAGQKLGVIGNSGYSSGTHLHFEVNLPNRRPQNSNPSGYDVTMAWMDAHTVGTW